MRRALIRAGVRLKYSEGFNPHPYLSVALPLPVGQESVCELIDVGIADDLLPDGLVELISAVLPEGLAVIEAYEPESRFSDITWVEISGELHYDAGIEPGFADSLAERFAADSIIVAKRTKRGVSDIDIAPFVRDVAFDFKDVLTMSAKVSAQNPTIGPDNLMSALGGAHQVPAPDFAFFARKEVYDKDMKIFR